MEAPATPTSPTCYFPDRFIQDLYWGLLAPAQPIDAITFDGSDQPLYLPLLEGRLIRLIYISPGLPEDHIVLRLLVVELGNHPVYDALSYVWGNVPPDHCLPVTCNGRGIDVTPNLHDALVTVRYPDRGRLVWADAICINQLNVDERSHHVAFMGSVYSNARRVLVCVGPDRFSYAKQIAALVAENAALIAKHPSILKMPILGPNDPIYDDQRWVGVSILVGLPWFTRAWVLQEVGLAKNPRVLFGDQEFAYRDLMNLGMWAKRCAPNLEGRVALMFCSAHVDWLDWTDDWKTKATYPHATFLDLLGLVRGLDCRDFRDHIYAFLGHPLAQMEDGSGTIVKPDYSRPAMDVFIELAVKLVPKEGFRLLASVDNDEEAMRDSSLSWIPFCREDENVASSFGIYTGYWYVASGDIDPIPPKLLESNFLRVEGFVVDIVDSTEKLLFEELQEFSRPLYGPNETSHMPTLNKIWTDLHDTTLLSAYGPDDRRDVFSLTFCAGLRTYNDAEADDILPEHRKEFSAFRHIWELSTPYYSGPSNIDAETRNLAEKYWVEMKRACEGRKSFFTGDGYCGLGPRIAQPGDQVCIFFGARVPFLLRRTEKNGHYKLVGEAYVHRLMRGGAAEMYKAGGLKARSFVIC